VEIWDDEDGLWRQFPNPLLTPPSQFLAKSFDWLPSVLESMLIAVARTHQAPVLSSLKPYKVLRELYDASPDEPASGLFEVTALATLTQWLSTGKTPSGAPTRVPDVTSDSTLEQRYEQTRIWLESIRSLAGDHFMKPGKNGARGGGTFSQIQTRRQAAATPLFRDVAEDIHVMLGAMIDHLDTAQKRALSNPSWGLSAEGNSEDLPDDDLGLPEIGAF
jgi:hypothetical protein